MANPCWGWRQAEAPEEVRTADAPVPPSTAFPTQLAGALGKREAHPTQMPFSQSAVRAPPPSGQLHHHPPCPSMTSENKLSINAEPSLVVCTGCRSWGCRGICHVGSQSHEQSQTRLVPLKETAQSAQCSRSLALPALRGSVMSLQLC